MSKGPVTLVPIPEDFVPDRNIEPSTTITITHALLKEEVELLSLFSAKNDILKISEFKLSSYEFTGKGETYYNLWKKGLILVDEKDKLFWLSDIGQLIWEKIKQ